MSDRKSEFGGLIFLFLVIGAIFAGIQFGWAAGVSAFFLFGAVAD
jgi:hypothetical protein